MNEFLQRFIDDTFTRIEGLRRDRKTEDVSIFAQSLERTALFLGATGLASTARRLRGALARTTGRGDGDVAAIEDVWEELEHVVQELQVLGGQRYGLPPGSMEDTRSQPVTDGPSVDSDNAHTIRLAIDTIVLGERLRGLDQAKVEMLESSMRDIGLRTPITVAADNTGAWRLVAGLHRLEAARRLNQVEIACFVLNQSEPAARLWEIDENLVRSELTQLERDQHLLRRKQIFDKWVVGETGRNPPALGGRGNNGFATDTEKKTGIAKRRVNESVHRATRIAGEVQDTIREMPAADIRVELDALASLDRGEQKLAVGKVQRGEAANFRAARRQIRGGAEGGKTNRHFNELRCAWRNAGPEARSRFLRWLCKTEKAEVRDLQRWPDSYRPNRSCEGRERIATVASEGRRRLRISYVGYGDDSATRDAT